MKCRQYFSFNVNFFVEGGDRNDLIGAILKYYQVDKMIT
jgi:hypothetical protein